MPVYCNLCIIYMYELFSFYRCHGLTYCSIPESALKSYVMHSQQLEQDCTPDFLKKFSLFANFRLERISRRTLFTSCRNDSQRMGTTCFAVTPDPSSFQDARDWCQQKGGDLATVYPDLKYSWVTGQFGVLTHVWVMGQSELERSVTPYIPPERLQPTIFSENDVSSCSSHGTCPDPLLGLCSFPMNTEDVVSLTDISSSQCSENTCVNGGTCWNLQGGRVMCDCPPGFYGDACEDGQWLSW